MAEGFGRGLAVAAILLGLAAGGMFVYLMDECFLFSGRDCDALALRTLYAAGGAALLGFATVAAVLTGEATPGRILLVLAAVAGAAAGALFVVMSLDAPWLALRVAGYAAAAFGALGLLLAPVAWRRSA